MNDTVDWFELLADRVVRGMFIESDNYEYFSMVGPMGLSHDFETGCSNLAIIKHVMSCLG